MDALPLFVFGTLRRGEPNHGYLAGRYDRCLPARLEGFLRGVAGHGFPAIIRSPGSTVEGELFFLTEATRAQAMAECDRLEDLPPGQLVGPYYRRAKVRVRTAEGEFTAWAYVDPETEVDENSFVFIAG
jgi:gamma-glutamylcyclotransferase (GGCT)/AIG2-like uncharacterized protein YtfP